MSSVEHEEGKGHWRSLTPTQSGVWGESTTAPRPFSLGRIQVDLVPGIGRELRPGPPYPRS